MLNGGSGFAEGPGESGLVSVVVPTFNRGYRIGETIDSLLAQSYRALEVIVVDDGSVDDTPAVIARYADKVTYIRQSNGGVCSARNVGLSAARGEFVALLDSDDSWLDWKLEAQIAVMRALPNVGMTWTDMIAVDDAGTTLSPAHLRTFYRAYQEAHLERAMTKVDTLGAIWPRAPRNVAGQPVYTGEVFSQMMLGNLVHTSTVLIRRDRLRLTGLFDVELLRSGEDYEFHLRTSYHGPVAFIDAPSIRYRIGAPDQLTEPSYAIDIARNNLRTVLNWQKRGCDRLTLAPDVMARRVATSYAWLGQVQVTRGELRAAAHTLARSYTHAPTMAFGFKTVITALLRAAFNLLPKSLRLRVRDMARSLKPAAGSRL